MFSLTKSARFGNEKIYLIVNQHGSVKPELAALFASFIDLHSLNINNILLILKEVTVFSFV